jgi:hypothetical protein
LLGNERRSLKAALHLLPCVQSTLYLTGESIWNRRAHADILARQIRVDAGEKYGLVGATCGSTSVGIRCYRCERFGPFIREYGGAERPAVDGAGVEITAVWQHVRFAAGAGQKQRRRVTMHDVFWERIGVVEESGSDPE